MENGLAVAFVIWWPVWPSRADRRMRPNARGYPWWPGAICSTQRAGYRSARPATASQDSACNARPVHTDGPESDSYRSGPTWRHAVL